MRGSVQLGAVFCIPPVFPMDEITHKQKQIYFVFKLFLNISITLEYIWVFDSGIITELTVNVS